MYPMMVIGDLHLKKDNLDVAEEFFNWLAVNLPKDVRSIVFLGDIYDSKSIVHVKAQNLLFERLSDLALHYKIYIIVGNHDFASTTLDINSLYPLQYIENVRVIDSPVYLEDLDILAVPYSDDPKTIETFIEEKSRGVLPRSTINKSLLVLGHFHFAGDFFSGNRLADVGVNKSVIGNNKVLLGHIHSPGQNHYLGSPFSHSFAECNEEKRVAIFRDKSYCEFIKVTGLPKHMKYTYEEFIAIEERLSKEDFIRVIDVPKDKLKEVCQVFADYKNIQFFLEEPKSISVRLDSSKSESNIVSDYVDKFVTNDNIDKKELLNRAIKIMEEVKIGG